MWSEISHPSILSIQQHLGLSVPNCSLILYDQSRPDRGSGNGGPRGSGGPHGTGGHRGAHQGLNSSPNGHHWFPFIERGHQYYWCQLCSSLPTHSLKGVGSMRRWPI